MRMKKRQMALVMTASAVALSMLLSLSASASIPGIITAWVVSGPIAAGGPGGACVPQEINHQGVVAVNGQRINGNADFKFALVDPDSGENRWTNDNSQLPGPGTPANPVNLPVIDGLFNVRLGDSDLTNMTSIPASVANDDNLVLRVWFDDGVHGEQQLSPDQRLTSVPYAFTAATSPPIGSIVAWHRDFGSGAVPPLPSGWLECDGQTVDDAASPLDGLALPNLNGESRFVRGSTLSGIFQEDATALPSTPFEISGVGDHTHTINGVGDHNHGIDRRGPGGPLSGEIEGAGSSGDQPTVGTLPAGAHTHSMQGAGAHTHLLNAGGDSETRPVNMTVIWIMRVK